MASDVDAFLNVAHRFQLGDLDTEASHPKTSQLSAWSRDDLEKGIDALTLVDAEALQQLSNRAGSLEGLTAALRTTLESGHRVFLCGCGATGRLSLTLEVLCRVEGLVPDAYRDRVIGFMAGGDAALIRSIERFEDLPEFGERQLVELGFEDGDLLVSSTEGGETPFVIGATEAAARLSHRHPFFLYCNPADLLIKTVQRSKRVLTNPSIHHIDLSVGPMALSGSTRMQASTVLMAAIGICFRAWGEASMLGPQIDALAGAHGQMDHHFLKAFIEEETKLYQNGHYVLYEPGPFGMTVLTDTTERSPTFTLTPFENSRNQQDLPSHCYLHLPGTESAKEAWHQLLGRNPRTLEWGSLKHLTGAEAIEGFDFSDNVSKLRQSSTQGGHHTIFSISRDSAEIVWRFGEVDQGLPIGELDVLAQHLLLKMFLNQHSTLVMGRLGRYEDNVMTYVSANNNKLIDRAIRYALLLLKRHHQKRPAYDDVARALFEIRESLRPNEPIVLRIVERFA